MQRHVTVDIRRNEGATIRNSFPQWEIPLLKMVHGEDAVVEVGERLVDRDLPEPNDEFARLTDRYKRSREEDGSYGPPYTHQLWGQMGVSRLAEEIKASFREAPSGDLVGTPDLVGAA